MALSGRALSQLDVRDRAGPWLTWLVQETGETATLSVSGGGEPITVDFVPAPSSVLSLARLSRPSVAHATALGKVMLAFGFDVLPLDPTAELARFTERTITDPIALHQELERVRRAGGPTRWANASPI